MRKHLCASLVLVAVMAPLVTGQQIVTVVDQEQLAEAIRIAADDKSAARFLAAYVVQPRAGWGDGPLIGTFSTPFSRVVQAAVAARRKRTPFGNDGVPADLVVPEVHVVATFQKAWPDEAMVAAVQSVVLVPSGSMDSGNAIQPNTMSELTNEYRTRHGITSSEPGVVAVFPLTALTPGTLIRVTFDRTARGFSGLSMCRECAVPVDWRRVR